MLSMTGSNKKRESYITPTYTSVHAKNVKKNNIILWENSC